jgi:hypothetical protein
MIGEVLGDSKHRAGAGRITRDWDGAGRITWDDAGREERRWEERRWEKQHLGW